MKFAIVFAALLATAASPVVAKSAPQHNRGAAALSVKNATKSEGTRHSRNDDRGRGNHGGHGRGRDHGHNNGHNGGHGGGYGGGHSGGHHGGGNGGHHGGGHHCHGDCGPVSP